MCNSNTFPNNASKDWVKDDFRVQNDCDLTKAEGFDTEISPAQDWWTSSESFKVAMKWFNHDFQGFKGECFIYAIQEVSLRRWFWIPESRRTLHRCKIVFGFRKIASKKGDVGIFSIFPVTIFIQKKMYTRHVFQSLLFSHMSIYYRTFFLTETPKNSNPNDQRDKVYK